MSKARLSLSQFFSIYLLVIIGLVFVLMGLSGRSHWLFVLLGGMIPFFSFALRNALGLFRAFTIFRTFSNYFSRYFTGQSGVKASKVQDSTIRTEYLDMTLNHGSGELDGRILKGPYVDHLLSDLKYESLIEMLELCREDDESTSLLMAYIERAFPEHQQRQSPKEDLDTIDELQALEILGLGPDPGDEEIIKAHRRLIQKMHPDRGGSTYLAARINEAKTILLGRKK